MPRADGAMRNDVLDWTVRSVLCLAVGVGLVACGPAGSPEVPAEIRGVWRTDHPDYEGRFFELREKTLVIAAGLEPPESYVVELVEEVTGNERLTHRIQYVNAIGQDYVLSIAFDRARQRVTYTNKPELVWYRD